ncbi:beta-mannosidase-like [Bradysia coprophila]|uniref:beta-mannosidase-like n=1 Tax=Bradysia coprophila TaxID=38358 RepID=UPI00187DD1A6|nr:beta-mannosidase-like [Bradysia coprophila]
MMGRTIFSIFMLTIICSLEVKCAKVVKSGIEQLSLNANRDSRLWTAIGNNGTQEFRVPAQVPGGIYSDLDAFGGIFRNQIYHDYNDVETRWVGRTDWTFTREFDVSNELVSKPRIVLICEGLDTIARVFINNNLVGQGVNMFVRYIYNIKDVLTLGRNEIRVEFQSPVLYAISQYNAHNVSYGYPVLPNNLVPEYRGEDKAQMIRKMQSSFSWDWGPSYPSSGIWKDIYIEGRDGAVIRDVLVFTSTNSQQPDDTDQTTWTLQARVYFDYNSREDEGFLLLQRLDGEFSARIPVSFQNETLVSGSVYRDISISVPGSEARLWWPNGYGNPTLYPYQVTYTASAGDETSSKTFNVGFRTVELIQDPVDISRPHFGNYFYFKVNGIKIYSKGSNSIPIHVLPERITDEMTEWLLTSAHKLHTNQIRVWGGGMYESDLFYDLADKLGIFVWEDFMFACSMYPANDDFLSTVVDEIDTQVKRLQHHPSLLMWAANNENEGALRDNWYGTRDNFEVYRTDFVKLYVNTIIRNVALLDPSRDCLSSSPTNGKKTEEEGWVSEWPGNIRYGDTHPYNYRDDNWDWRWMVSRRSRYASEFGYQSFPYVETLRKVSSNFDQWTWFSEFVDHRQHHPGGQGEIHDLIQSHLPMPTNPNSTEAFPSMLYMAQIMQSMGQKTQTEFYRRNVDKFFVEEDGTGYNMGALYWQLNDIWEGCSWSSFEINGRWKMYAYFAQRAFSPVLASPYKDTNEDVAVEVISDSVQRYTGSLRVRIFKLDSLSPVFDEELSVTADYLTSKEQFRMTSTMLETLQCQANQTGAPCLVYTSMPQLPDNFVFLNYPTDRHYILDPKLKATDIQSSVDGRTITFTLTSEAIAPFVFLNLRDHTNGHFSDNGFVMVEREKVMTYYSRDVMTIDDFVNQLDTTSLFDVTQFADDDHDHDDAVSISAGLVPLVIVFVICFSNGFV